jgi:hypothetical protein
MSYLRELPNACMQDFLYYAECDELDHILQAFAKLLREPSLLTHAERELFGTYALALNNAQQPLNVHGRVLALHGGEQWKVQDLVKDPEHRCLEHRLRPVAHIVRKLTFNAHSICKADIEACYEAGFDGRTLHQIVYLTGLFACMSRWTSALGMKYTPEEIINSSDGLYNNGYFGEGPGLHDEDYREQILPQHKPIPFREEACTQPRNPTSWEPNAA